MKASGDPGAGDTFHHLMKFGPHLKHYYGYICCVCTHQQNDAINLSGIPDILETLPRCELHRFVHASHGNRESSSRKG